MKVLKPQALGLLTRPFEFRRKCYCGVAVMTLIPLSGKRSLSGESAMWTMAAEVMGEDLQLDDGLPKQKGEFLVAGNAWPAPGGDRTKLRIRVSLGDRTKELNVFGDRYFHGDQVTGPEPFESMPLCWSRAFGGEKFAQNPLGKGHQVITNEQGQRVHPLPNIEYPDDMLSRVGQTCRPAGLGRVDVTWPQRGKLAGTYDQAWLKQDYPGFAADIDWSFFNVASEDQRSKAPFSGTESFELVGLHPEHARISGQLPGIRARCFIRRRQAESLEELACALTTVWFFPDRMSAILVFHGSCEVAEPDASDLAEVMIAAEEIGKPRDMSHYQDVYRRRMDGKTGAIAALKDGDLLPEGLDQADTLDADTLIRNASQSIFGANFERRMKRQLEEGDRELREQMAQFDIDVPDPEPLAFNTDPDYVRSLDIDQTIEYVKKVEEEADRQRAKAEALQRDGMNELDEAIKQLREAFPDHDIEEPQPHTGPPKFSADEQRQLIADSLNEMETQGLETGKFEVELLGEDMTGLLDSAERNLVSTYRKGGHYQSPIPGPRGESEKLRQALLEAISRGESVDAQDFTAVDLSGIDLSGADLSGIFLESANLVGANLSGARLDGAMLARADLSDACLDRASLVEANLGRATLDRASLREADMSRAILTNARLVQSNFEGSKLDGAELSDAVLDGSCWAHVSAPSMVFMDVVLTGADFSGAVLPKALFVNLDLGECKFDKAELTGASFVRCLGHAASFQAANLTNTRFVEACDFSRARFSNAVLTEANLRSTLLEQCDFTGADLCEADLSDTSLRAACLDRAMAKGTRFINANLQEASLAGCNAMGGFLERADLRAASLGGANLYAADLARVHVDRKTVFDKALTTKMRTYPRKFIPGVDE